MNDFWKKFKEQLQKKSVEIKGLQKIGEPRPKNYLWVMFDDVLGLLDEFKQHYVVVEREKLKETLQFGGSYRDKRLKLLYSLLEELILDFAPIKKTFVKELLKDEG
jgi:hypothetical protein